MKIFNKIQNKFLATLLLISLVPLVLLGTYSMVVSSKTIAKRTSKSSAVKIKFRAEKVSMFLKNVQGDLSFLSNNVFLYQLIDVLDGNDIEQQKKKLREFELELLGLALTRKIYYKLRYVDAKGQEIVRVDFKESLPKIVPQEKLQNKASRYYFQNTMMLESGQMYVSDLDLNVEEGKIEIPYRPVIRYAMPIYDSNDNKKGMIVLSVLTNFLLQEIAQWKGQWQEQSMMVDDQGFYLEHPDKKKEWGGPKSLNTGEGLKKDFSAEIVSRILSGKSDQIKLNDEVIFSEPIFLHPDRKDIFLVLIVKLKKSILFAPIIRFRNTFIGIIFFVCVLVVIIGLILSKFLTKSITNLSYIIKKTGEGSWDASIEIPHTGDEIENLYESFQKMTNDLRKSTVSKNYVDNIIKTMTDALIVIDERGVIDRFNRGAEEIFGYSEKEVRGENVSILMPEPYHSQHDNYIKHYIKTGEVKILARVPRELKGIRKNRDIFDLELVVNKLHVSGQRMFAGIIRDITKRKRMEETIRKHNELLEQKVAERTSEAIKDKLKAEKANQAKSEFLANMSHEIRTPLHGVINFADLGLEKIITGNHEKSQLYFKKILNCSNILLGLINNLLDLGKLESRKMEFKFVLTDIGNLVETAANEMQALGQKRNIQVKYLKTENRPYISVDAKKISQVLKNLLSNSIQFSKENGIIECCVEDLVDYINVLVKDDGIGVPGEELDVIFDKFKQSSKTKTGAGGTGLGLAICKKIIDGHDGKIWAEHNPDGGVIFQFTIKKDLCNKKRLG